jgi:hypothetical protein
MEHYGACQWTGCQVPVNIAGTILACLWAIAANLPAQYDPYIGMGAFQVLVIKMKMVVDCGTGRTCRRGNFSQVHITKTTTWVDVDHYHYFQPIEGRTDGFASSGVCNIV